MPPVEALAPIARLILSDFSAFPRELFHPALLSPEAGAPAPGEVEMLQGVLLLGGGLTLTEEAPGARRGRAFQRGLYLLMDGRLVVAQLAARYEESSERCYQDLSVTLRVDFSAAAELELPAVSRLLVTGLTRVGAPGELVHAAQALAGPFVTLTRRTGEPKLSWLERQLTLAGITHRRHGRTVQAPILQVAEHQLAKARAVLEPVDGVPASHPRFRPG